MGRKRTIKRDTVLDAAEQVVIRDGAARLTLDAVACEAGISKASVLYDYKTKQALIKAVVERRVAAHTSCEQALAESFSGDPDAAIRSRIEVASHLLTEEDRAVALGLLASLAQDADLREPIARTYGQRIAQITGTSRSPRGALLAFLALEGLMSLEWLGLHNWAPEERARIIAEIGWLVDQVPAPAPSPSSSPERSPR
ncbi:TetR/AcrR family transcriptional regulator [Stappia sp. TSB10P1A]|uniref:TetR/AcrR family transcriptional regulator n=1 Tax=Stappia sp. TSB10P1A TaxID=2003585 RepID=UPI0016437144|nr:TetR/AcrR family transcriptional regulator [Stappia sp. TSB10P1A]